jgi:fatty acid desaturase
MNAIVSVGGFRWMLGHTFRIARGRIAPGWETVLFPPDAVVERARLVRWARIVLGGHLVIVAGSLALGWWTVPVVTTLAPFYGGWLFFLHNNTQHVGLTDNEPDFRVSCRTMVVNPFFRFLYWHMNWHTEHHMYAAVPCYRLHALHRAIRHDLPPVPVGLAATWREIAAILARQAADPAYRHRPPLPGAPSVRTS